MQSIAQLRQVSRKNQKSKKISFQLLNILALALIVVALGFYVALINSITANGYSLKEKEAWVSELREQNRKLLTSLYSKSSMVDIIDRAKELGMVESGKAHYVSLSQSVVVRK